MESKIINPLVDVSKKDLTRDNDSSVLDYVALLKPRVMALAVFTSICGLYLAPGSIHPFLAFTAIVCISVGAGASGAINMWYDKDIDTVMKRTKNRPLPTGKIHPKDALGYGVILAIGSVLMLGLFLNYYAAMLLAFSISFYVFIYTMWLKRTTHHNTVIGGAAGAFPPVIGWACVTGDISAYPLILFLIVFVWTPPHFWALALYKDVEYSKVNIPMLPVIKGKYVTKCQILIYSFILAIASLAPYYFNFTGIFYLSLSAVINIIFLYFAFKVFFSNKLTIDKRASNLFRFSILYLYLLFMGCVFDKLIGI